MKAQTPYRMITEEEHIEEILTEANAYGLRAEVKQYAEKLLDESPEMDPIDAYTHGFEEWIKQIMKKRKEGITLKEVRLTLQEWFDALRVPTPVRNKKKYKRNKKHKNKDGDI